MSLSLFKYLSISILLLTANHLFADNGQPDLWQVEKNGNTSYLFGSIHLGSPEMYPLSDAVYKAYSSTEHLMVEIDLKPEDEAKMLPLIKKYGFNPKVPLEKRLSREGLALYKQICLKESLPCQKFSTYQAWFLSVQLSLMNMQKLGFQDELGIDKHFLKKAHQTNRNVSSLETAESQFKLLGGFNQQQQESMLLQSLQMEEEDFIGLFDAWKSGDDDAMSTMFQVDFEQSDAKAMHKALFDDRNINMTRKISENINANKSLFVVVGAGDIIGEMGIVKLLRKAGFKLVQIQ